MQLKYYNSDVHQAAFVLPEFARKVGCGGVGQGTRGPPRAHLSPHAARHPPDEALCPPRP